MSQSEESVDDDNDDDFSFDMFDDDADSDNSTRDLHRCSSLIDSLLEAVRPGLPRALTTSNTSHYRVRSAISSDFRTEANEKLDSSSFGDFINNLLYAPPLAQRAATAGSDPYYLSFKPEVKVSDSKPKVAPTLFVGNVPNGTTWKELNDYFNRQNYTVQYVNVKSNVNGRSYAILRFTSVEISTQVLYECESNRSKFVFNGRVLRISLKTASPQQANVQPTPAPILIRPTSVEFDVDDVHYGTLITGEAMRNLRKGNSIISSSDQMGVIGHCLNMHDYDISFKLKIDLKKRKLSIISACSSLSEDFTSVCADLVFEWNFRDVRGNKINPVLVTYNTKDEQPFLLLEVKRAPLIVKKESISQMDYDSDNEVRQPGTALIGHANAWLLKLSSRDRDRDYVDLFRVLSDNNLTPKRFTEHNILTLISTLNAARRNLNSILLISNDDWIKQNQDKVDDFTTQRWPSYSFEMKFEMMKLISQHIITVNDLVVDETLDDILSRCSTNTLIACTDKIVELAPRWFSAASNDDDEDWDNQDDDVDASIDVSDTEPASTAISMAKLSSVAKQYRLGSLSRLLLFALNELEKSHLLRQDTTTNLYVTKREMRAASTSSSLIRKVYITPSTILYEGPFSEEKCAVTRAFNEHQDRFMRVSFRDEDYRLLHNFNNNMTLMYERIKNILMKGVSVCDRKYEFVAFSSSQLREHSCWMFASTNNGKVTANSIREWMGDFRNIRPVAKFAARLGQSFSTSVKGIQLENRQFREVSDIMKRDDANRELCFTDGIGMITQQFAQRLIEEVKPALSKACPSAFQIRCGGYKGMVCVDVANCIPKGEVDISFRPSMRKFIALNFSIDVVRTSSVSLAYLNRQIILLLSALSIPDSAFLDLQEQMRRRTSALTEDSRKACEALRELNEFGGNGCHALLIDYLRKLGQHKEPFARQLLFTFQAFLLKELRTKAKILVPNAWSLFGVADETRELKYGQVFIQIDSSNQQGGPTQILRGPVIVTRNPCFHPGDIRRLEAVDIPALRELKNVIVFPTQGLRPHALEMSGGDLDGDLFWISQHKEFIFDQNDEPFEYQDQTIEAQKKAELENKNQITIEDVCNFFGEYIEADNVGLIANSHLAFADHLPEGARDEKCLILARMHSVAVDFAKNGVKAPRLDKNLRPAKYPHYMEKKDKVPYQSETILGKLYDQIKDCRVELDLHEDVEITATSGFPYRLFQVDGFETFMQEAKVSKSEYDRKLKRVMRQYGIKHEAEILSGYILKLNSKQYSNETKMFELRNEITHAYKVIRDEYIREFWEEFYHVKDDVQGEEESRWPEASRKLTWKHQLNVMEYYGREHVYDDVKKKASAWFRVTYEPWLMHIRTKKNRATTTNNQNIPPAHHYPEQHQSFKGLFSFAWVVYPVLLDIYEKNEGNTSQNNTESKKKKRKKYKKNKNKNKKKDAASSSDTNQEPV